MNVTEVINHYGNFIVTANVDGKRDLPEPLVLVFCPMSSPNSSTRSDNAFCAGKRQAHERPFPCAQDVR
jgi:hypothetical protein